MTRRPSPARQRGLEVTTMVGCRVGCTYCPQGLFTREQRRVDPTRLLSFEVFAECLRTVPTDVRIHFSGYTEPFLNPACGAMIRHAHERGHTVAVFTTLVGLTREQVPALAGVPFWKFVIHAPDDGTHMRVDVDAEYLAVLDAVLASDIPNQAWVGYFDVHPEIARRLARRFPPTGEPLVSRGGGVTETLVVPPEPRTGPLRCVKNRLHQNVLLPNGDVTLCCMDYGRRHVLGNLRRETYADLHAGEEFRRVRARLAGDPGDLLCRSCEWAASPPRGWRRVRARIGRLARVLGTRA